MQIPKDKLKHLIIGSFVSFAMIFTLGYIGLVLSLIVFALKEIVWDDYLGKGVYEVEDFLYAAIPCLIIYIFYVTLIT